MKHLVTLLTTLSLLALSAQGQKSLPAGDEAALGVIGSDNGLTYLHGDQKGKGQNNRLDDKDKGANKREGRTAGGNDDIFHNYAVDTTSYHTSGSSNSGSPGTVRSTTNVRPRNRSKLKPIDSELVYPNPASGDIRINVDQLPFQQGNLKITGVHGKVVYAKPLPSADSSGELKIDIRSLNPGWYSIEIYSDEQRVVQLILVQ